jgi:putative transcriptional regulator
MKKAKRNIGREILESVREIKSGKGKRYAVCHPEEVNDVRQRLQLSQHGFASMLGVSIRTLQAWEQGRRRPSGAALALLTIASKRPDVVMQVLKPAG